MADDRVLIGSIKLSTVLTDEQEFIEQLALCLDREMRLISNWKHLALKLNVDKGVIKRLEQYSDFSPTIRLFEYLKVTQPDLGIEQLRKALSDIRRNDLVTLLTTKAGCADSEKVQEVITSRNNQAPSLCTGLLDEIALALDATSPVLKNWNDLAMGLGVPRNTCLELGRRSTHNPTNQLFQYFAATRPQITLKSLKEALEFIERNDLLQILQRENLRDELLLKDIMIPGSELLQTMTVELNREGVPGVKNWSHLACNLEVPIHVRQDFGGEQTRPKKSPTKEVIQWLAVQFPDMTLIDIVRVLEMIQRNDAIQIITKHFPDTVESSLKQLGSSLHRSLSFELPNDPTGEPWSSQSKREEQGFLPKQATEKEEQSGHWGSLPDRMDLVGREDTCEQIMTTLTSNKAVEIVGPPGYGKTSVVVEVAHRMIEKGKRVAYVNPRGVTCVEDLGSRIIEALGAVPGEDTIKETLRRIRTLKPRKSVVLIIENIDNLLYVEEKVRNEKDHDELESELQCAKMSGKYKKDDFLTFLKDIGQSSTIHLVLTSRDTNDFVAFPIQLIDLPPLSAKDSASSRNATKVLRTTTRFRNWSQFAVVFRSSSALSYQF